MKIYQYVSSDLSPYDIGFVVTLDTTKMTYFNPNTKLVDRAHNNTHYSQYTLVYFKDLNE